MELVSPSLDHTDVIRAAFKIRSHIRNTPIVTRANDGIALKLECLQHTGAYKVRGALNAVLSLKEQGRLQPIVAASAGNHSSGIAWAAKIAGMSAYVVVPTNTPQKKLRNAEALGARIIQHGDNFDEALIYAQALAKQNTWSFVHAFDDSKVIAGQGTLAFELLSHNPKNVFVPIGGGGLISGLSLILRKHNINLIGVQVKGSTAFSRYFAKDYREEKPKNTIADGVRVTKPGSLCTQLSRGQIDRFVVVSEQDVKSAIADLYLNNGIICEGAGALGLAAAQKLSLPRSLVVVTGGNIDTDMLERIVNDSQSRVPPSFQRSKAG